jgi:hypothetical protein
VKRLKTLKGNLNVKKKIIEDKVAKSENVAKILGWIKETSDPEPTLNEIEKKVTSEGRYETYGQWFLDSPEYKCWCDQFQLPESPTKSKRVLWLNGPYGTGKTTILFVNLPGAVSS